MGARQAKVFNCMQKLVSGKTHAMLSGRQLCLQTKQNTELTEKLPLVPTLVVSNDVKSYFGWKIMEYVTAILTYIHVKNMALISLSQQRGNKDF